MPPCTPPRPRRAQPPVAHLIVLLLLRYFVFAVDSSESELGILDLIQVFVESLDKRFENVCELDLIFHVDKVRPALAPARPPARAPPLAVRLPMRPAAHQVHHILDEVVMGAHRTLRPQPRAIANPPCAGGMVLETNMTEILTHVVSDWPAPCPCGSDQAPAAQRWPTAAPRTPRTRSRRRKRGGLLGRSSRPPALPPRRGCGAPLEVPLR